MNEIMNNENLKEMIFELRGERVLLDSDVAKLYGVETKRINEAVKNNPEKFPQGYLFQLTKEEWDILKSKISTSNLNLRSKISTANFSKIRTMPTVFPEKGLYMLATILKSSQATAATLAIIETFAKIKELSRNIKELSVIQNPSAQKTLMQKSGELLTDIFDNDLGTNDTETTLELNFAVLKFKHTIKKKK
ncbi:MAG: DNA-binding protein [Verrucomicrobia bacterium RIFCSPHIGHO2_12_FULL_41_10]|nr:MAG: DNA-binding protein [Verrucomicrobia bacterium RIFCSPHIGHO2_12_FULL_41_10]